MKASRTIQSLLASVLLSLSFGLQAQQQLEDFTPVNGWYWKPLQGGTGINLEIQDNYIVLSVYAYDLFGIGFWYVAGGEMEGNNYFSGPLVEAEGGQCVGCEWTLPVLFNSSAGNITLEWTSKNTILVTFGGETNLFERQLNAVVMRAPLTKMLGEWKVVMDFDGAGLGFPFLADILTFDSINTFTTHQPQFEGYRNHTADSAAGTYDEDSGLYQIVVAEPGNINLLLFDVDAGTSGFTGIAEFYDRAVGPAYSGYPIEGFRSASASYVQTTFGPSKAEVGKANVLRRNRKLLSQLPGTLTSSATGEARQRLVESVKAMESRLQEKRQASAE